jgi:excisionase family DNA binding protein
LLSPAEAAELLGLSEGTLAVWRSTGRYGLPFVKCGRRAKYRLEDLLTFIARRTRGGEPTGEET